MKTYEISIKQYKRNVKEALQRNYGNIPKEMEKVYKERTEGIKTYLKIMLSKIENANTKEEINESANEIIRRMEDQMLSIRDDFFCQNEIFSTYLERNSIYVDASIIEFWISLNKFKKNYFKKMVEKDFERYLAQKLEKKILEKILELKEQVLKKILENPQSTEQILLESKDQISILFKEKEKNENLKQIWQKRLAYSMEKLNSLDVITKEEEILETLENLKQLLWKIQEEKTEQEEYQEGEILFSKRKNTLTSDILLLKRKKGEQFDAILDTSEGAFEIKISKKQIDQNYFSLHAFLKKAQKKMRIEPFYNLIILYETKENAMYYSPKENKLEMGEALESQNTRITNIGKEFEDPDFLKTWIQNQIKKHHEEQKNLQKLSRSTHFN